MIKILKDDTGSALVTVLIIISLISIITMGIMGATALQQRFIKRDLNRMQAFYLAEAGIQKTLWLLNRENDQNWRVTNFQIPLFDGLKADISLMDWGAFLLVQSRANYKKQTAKIETIIGEKMPAAFQQAVIIGGTEYPLVVTGNNQIVGDVTTGKAGVKTGIIQGQGFTGKQMVAGKINILAPARMPSFDDSQLIREVNRFEGYIQTPQGLEINSRVVTPENFKEFANEKVIYVYGDLMLSGESMGEALHFDGPEIVVALGKISVQDHVNLANRTLFVTPQQIELSGSVSFQDCIFYGRTGVSTAGAVNGSGQFISLQKMEIGAGTRLTYPSVLYCCGQETENRVTGEIKIASQTSVTGSVIYQFGVFDDGKIVLEKGGLVTGMVYSDNIATIEGRIHGIVITEKFQFYSAPTTYINWLKDAVIDRNQLPADFVLPVGFRARPEFEAVRWREL